MGYGFSGHFYFPCYQANHLPASPLLAAFKSSICTRRSISKNIVSGIASSLGSLCCFGSLFVSRVHKANNWSSWMLRDRSKVHSTRIHQKPRRCPGKIAHAVLFCRREFSSSHFMLALFYLLLIDTFDCRR